MADMETTYGGGRSTTTTRGLGAAGGTGMLFDPSVLGSILAQRMRQKEEDRAFELEQRERFKQQQKIIDARADEERTSARAAKQGPRVGRAAMPEIGESVQRVQRVNREADPYEAKMKALRYRDALSQSEAAGGPAPTRVVQGPGIVTGRTLDPLAMNAYQRGMFLPAAAHTVEGPSDRGGEELEEFADQDFRRQARARALERMQAGQIGGRSTRVTGWGG